MAANMETPDPVVEEMDRKWLAQQQEIEALWEQNRSLKNLVLDLQAMVAELQTKKTEPVDVREQLALLAKERGIKAVADELNISERSVHRLTAGGGSLRLRRLAERRLTEEHRSGNCNYTYSSGDFDGKP